MSILPKTTSHDEHLFALKRIEGQLRGIQKMIEARRYCVDIITQLHAASSALERVEGQILKKHMENCVVSSFAKGGKEEVSSKVNEIITLLRKFRR